MSRRFRMPRASDGTPLSLLGILAIASILLTVVVSLFILRPYYLPRPVAFAKMKAMVDGTKIVRDELTRA
mgnify:CR=1 FL=1